MGAKDSKPSFINYDDAVKRVSDSELRRIGEAFKKSAGSTGVPLSKNAFIHDVLGDGVPPIIADWLFTACGGTRRGIGFKDLLCGLVLLTKGTEEERTKFLWSVYCNEAGTHILKWEMMKVVQLESCSSGGAGQAQVASEAVSALFGRQERVEAEQFSRWLRVRPAATVLTRWLLLEPAVSLTSDLETPTFYQTLAGVTHLEERDICALEKCFWALRSRSPSGQLDAEVLAPLLSPPVPRCALRGLLLALDENRDGHVDFKELCCGLSAACRGPTCERVKFCFKVFDTDRDGFLNQAELRHMASVLCFVANEALRNQNAAPHPSMGSGSRLPQVDGPFQPDTVFKALKERILGENADTSRPSKEAGETAEEKEKCNNINDTNNLTVDNTKTLSEFREKESFEAEMDKDGEKEWGLSQEDFLIWSVERAEALLAPFLQLVYEVCHVVLGLRPQCKHQEQDIVLGWLSREVRRGYSVGQFWYLVSADWWASWQAHTSGTERGAPCNACGRRAAPVPPVDEAIVCDESFNSTESMGDLLGRAETSSLGSGSSSSGVSSSSSRSSRHPGPIDNSHLLVPNPYKVQTLTGEGGHLRKDLMLAQHRDFELLPDVLWKALAQWYGGPQPLPRQVIQPPNSDVELELYPRNLRLLKHKAPAPVSGGGGSSWSGMVGGYGAAALSTVGMASYPQAPPAQPLRQLAYTAAFSRLATVKQVSEFICSQLGLAREDVRLWMVGTSPGTTGSAGELLEEEHKSLSDLGAADGQRLLVEVRNKDLTWPEELGALSLSAAAGEARGAVAATAGAPHPAGATGLHNLGNTCFMNAALQAVWNTGPLTRYFTRNMHLYELNTVNPHGTGGALAQRYGELCKEVWNSGARSVAPLRVRWCVIRHAARFEGGGQHDSQELLAWLLDALHEDLNRVAPHVSPYAELRDSGGRPDQIVAQEAWDQHTDRNQSIITELFYGQLKSKVTCASCGHESVRFDPFNMLSLPLPMESYTLVEVLVILLDGSVPTKYGVRLPSSERYWNLKQRLSSLCELPATSLLLAELGTAWPARLPADTARVRPATATQLLAYQLPDDDNHHHDGPIGMDDDESVDGGAGDVAPAAERNSTSSDYGESPTINNYLSSKNVQSLDTPNGSSGYNSIQDHDATNHPITCQTSSPKRLLDSRKALAYDTSPKKFSPRGSPTFGIKSTGTSPNPKKKLSTPILSNKNDANVTNRNETVVSNRLYGGNVPDDNKSMSSGENILTSSESGSYSMDTIKEIPNGIPAGNNRSNMDSLRRPFFLVAVHRKQSRREVYFLSQQSRRWEVFGAPLVTPASEGSSGRTVYAAVWRQVERLLSAPPPAPPDQANHATDCDDSLGYTFPFTLRVVGRGGLRCAVCPWTRFCRGCALPCTDEPLLINLGSSGAPPPSPPVEMAVPAATPSPEPHPSESVLRRLDFAQLREAGCAENVHLAIDWDPTALHLRYQSNREKIFTEHESVTECRVAHTAPVQLAHCLRSFTSEERLEERYACATCRSQQPATKKLQIWRLPPVLVIHLKRFQYVNNKWIKSQKVVNFPYEDFDPTAFLASVPQETILRHADVSQHRANKLLLSRMAKHQLNEDEESADELETGDKYNSEINSSCESRVNGEEDDALGKDYKDLKNMALEGEEKTASQRNSLREIALCNRKASVIETTRERLKSTSLIKTPVLDDDFTDFHQHKLLPGQDTFNLKYRLYAVVSHSGMMNGGHYVAYAKNPSGTWYCYNDSSCRELSVTEVGSGPAIDPGSAYMLFYERTGLDYEPYLPDVKERQPLVNEAEMADGEDMDMKKMCVLS